LEEKARRLKTRKLESYYPDTGPLRRELYVKHLEFFRRGTVDRERLFLAANRVGKTEGVGGYELKLHLTGKYPHWWEGRRFDHPIDAWAAGDTGKTTRDIIQFKLLGPVNEIGTGLIPAESLVGRPLSKAGIPDAFEIVRVQHDSGGISMLGLKSYDQKREAFQGTEKHVILLDEEPPMSIYTECLLRTMKTSTFDGGCILCTFTPLMGLSEVVLMYLPGGKLPV
jgi:phage terminase large subunit-like protein